MPFYQTDTLRIHYRIDGPEHAPVLVLLNSIATDLSVWGEVTDELRQSMRILRYDARGQGETTAPDGPYSIAMLAQDLVSLLDGLDLSKVHLCGLSLGAMVAMQMATAYPQRVDRLVLCNTAAQVGPPESWDMRAAAVREHGMQAVRPAVLERWLSADFRERQPQAAQRVVEMALASAPAGYIGSCAAIRDMDQRISIGAIAAPVLVVGSASDAATPPADGRYIAGAIGGARYVELPGGHLSNVEEPARLAAEIRNFL
ncbi:MAG: 3-oxoadipate enol-lactonase [Pseudomonadota bacterium]